MFVDDLKMLPQSISLTSFDNNRRSLLISEDDFSDDSLENGSIPANDVPKAIKEINEDDILKSVSQQEIQPFSLTPVKCNPGIAWEIKLDADDEIEKSLKV